MSTETKANENIATPPKSQAVKAGSVYRPIIVEHDNEQCVFQIRASLYRFDKDENEWKERGTGDLRMFRNKSKNTVRIVMHRDKILTICANHMLSPGMSLTEHPSSPKFLLYHCVGDVSYGELSEETLMLRFSNKENADNFKIAFEKACERKFTDEDQVEVCRLVRPSSQGDTLNDDEEEENGNHPPSSPGATTVPDVEKTNGKAHGNENGETADLSSRVHQLNLQADGQ